MEKTITNFNSPLFQQTDRPAAYMVPKGAGTVDVVNDYAWTLSPQSSRKDVPVLVLEEYSPSLNILYGAIAYFYQQGRSIINSNTGINFSLDIDNPDDVYKARLVSTKTGFTYRIPALSDRHSSTSNVYSEEVGGIDVGKIGAGVVGFLGAGIVGVTKKFAALAATAGTGIAIGNWAFNRPSVGFEALEAWNGTGLQNYSYTFELLNTVSVVETEKNIDLIFLLEYQSLFQRRSVYLKQPPCVYSARVDGLFNIPVAGMNGIEVTNLGMSRVIREGKHSGKTVPEAFSVTLSFQELLPQSRNIHKYNNTLRDSDRIDVFFDEKKAEKLVNGIPGKVIGAIIERVPDSVTVPPQSISGGS